MKREKGFTVIEILVVIAVLAGACVLFITQKAQLDAVQRDSHQKTAINAMYYNLEELYFETNSYYPPAIDSKTLRAMDPELFTDPNGVKLGDASSTYRYEAKDCVNSRCKEYTLHADLEREADYVKTSRNKS